MFYFLISGVNCSKTDLDKINEDRNDTELLYYNNDLWYTKYYE